MLHTPQCRNCGKSMDVGFLVEKGNHDALSQSEWAEGLPEKSFWTGLKLKGRQKVRVTTYRCPMCGLLESYALEAHRVESGK